MTIPTIEYRGYELRAYSHQVFPLHRDPYAKGPRQFSSVVRIDTIPFSEGKALGAGGYNEDHEFDGYRVPI